jgi:hypothetical protein
MKRLTYTQLHTAALCALWLGTFASAHAASGPAPHPQRGQELANPQASPLEASPMHEVRAGERPGKRNARIGDPVPQAPEDTASLQQQNEAQANAAAAFFPYYYTVTGNKSMPLPSRNAYVCALHKLQGIMDIYAMSRVRYFEDGTQEVANLDGNGAFTSMAACVPKYKFFNNSASPISKVFDTKYSFAENSSAWYYEEWGNAAAMLSGIGGPFRGLGDRAWIWQADNNARNTVDIASDGAGYIIGYSTTFWFNESSGPQKGIKFIGPGGTGSASLAGEYFVGQDTVGTHSVSMAPASEGLCYLTGVNGGLSNYADRVEIKVHPTTNRYVLEVSKSNGEALHAYARCMAFDQR